MRNLNKIVKKELIKLYEFKYSESFNNNEFLEEAEESESGGESSDGEKSSTGKEWESGVTRGPANPITYDTEWVGQRGWEGIKAYNVKRGKSNPLK